MPIRNTIKEYETSSYYHVYNRGAAGQNIFRDAEDRERFLALLSRHLNPTDKTIGPYGYHYEKYTCKLIAYCLMDNHFHLLIYLDTDTEALTKLMRSISTAYTMYFNRKYQQSGHLFQSIFKASRVCNEVYLMHITRYIHMNPQNYLSYEWSSLKYYLGDSAPGWLNHTMLLDMTTGQYAAFLKDYQGHRAELKKISKELASL